MMKDLNMTTANKTGRPKRKTGQLKMLLLTSSLVATLAGTHLLDIKEALQPAEALVENNLITMVEHAAQVSTDLLPPTSGRQQIVQMRIPQVVQPRIRPVARSRSSR
jgi:hypothetical protein